MVWHVQRVGVNIYGIQCGEQGKFLNASGSTPLVPAPPGGGTADGTLVQLWGDNANASGHNAWCFTTSVQSDGTKVTGIQSIYNGKFLFAAPSGTWAQCQTTLNGVFHSSSWELISFADHQRNNAERSTEAAP